MAKRAYIGVNNFEPVDLPSGYTQVEYIQSSGTQYINTGYTPNNNTRIVCKVSGYPATNTNQTLYGSRSGVGSSDGFMFLTTSQNCYRTDFDGTTSNYAASVSISDNLIIDKNKNITTLNGANKNTISGSAFTSTYPIYIFAANNGGTADFHTSGVKLYYLMIYDNDVLIRHFIPCKNTSGAIGLYDLVYGVFYSNAGTGTFTEGTSIISGVSRRAKRMYIGVDDISRKIKKGYIGVDGIARLFYTTEMKTVTEIITTSGSWVCPENVTSINVRLFGGGAGGGDGYSSSSGVNISSGYGGCGGRMNTADLTVIPGISYTVTIGAGGTSNRAGGPTSFGTLLSASGGSSSEGGTGGGAGFTEAYATSYPGNATYGGAGGGGGHTNAGGSASDYDGGDNSTYSGGKGVYYLGQGYGGGGAGYTGNGRNATNSDGGSGGSGQSCNGGSGGGLAGGGGGGINANGGRGSSGGGGGGGFGGVGGDGQSGGGGGGGYGSAGAGGKGGSSNTAGSSGGIAAGGGGGGYNNSRSGGQGGKGICIITYLIEV